MLQYELDLVCQLQIIRKLGVKLSYLVSDCLCKCSRKSLSIGLIPLVFSLFVNDLMEIQGLMSLEILKACRREHIVHVVAKRVNLAHLVLGTVLVFLDLSRDFFFFKLPQFSLKFIKLSFKAFHPL